MKDIHLLSKNERMRFFKTAAEMSRIPLNIIEKDYWVVWILGRLFSLKKLTPHLTFKGGTSLSKVFGVISRFSEDIDITIEKEFFGFGPPNDPDHAPSKKKQQVILENLSIACSKYVQGEMLADLKEKITSNLGTTEGWKLFIDQEDPDAQTLLFEYPREPVQTGYIRPIVKIEMGSRSEHWPVSEHTIQSYVKDSLQEKINESPIRVRVLNAERTFWEKATILHQYAHLPETKNLPQRISRHFYDFYCLLNSPIKEKALNEAVLLDQVATHKSIYFASSWAMYTTARKKTLKLFPPERLLKELEKDYVLMEPMFFKEIPEWEKILKTIQEFEQEFKSC